jgi:hypothetical protein
MTYLDAVLYTGGVIWCGFMGIILLVALSSTQQTATAEEVAQICRESALASPVGCFSWRHMPYGCRDRMAGRLPMTFDTLCPRSIRL